MSIPTPGSAASGTIMNPQVNALSGPQDRRAHLADEFSNAVTEAQSLLHRAATEGGERARELRAEVEDKLRTARERLQQMQEQATDRAKEAARGADHFVHAHPWQAIGLATAAGLVVGLLMHRR
jgi:ElaB/YqjD/DUF883 family membrane-anchored ribosome-binding protein